MGTLAVLMACHNRKHITLRSVDAIMAMATASLKISVILVNDGSTDGTAEAINLAYPDVTVLHGSGTLFWGGAMHAAFARAMEQGFDYYLWLNDDALLNDQALDRLLDTYRLVSLALGPETITVGSVAEPDTQAMSYGGWKSKVAGSSPFRWASWEKQEPDSETWRECATMNGNCVLIPDCVARRVGNIDSVFRHVGGDLDYGLRAANLGCHIVIAPGYVGICESNKGTVSWMDRRLSLMERWRQLLGPKAFPWQSWSTFTRRHKGALWFIPCLAPYVLFWLRGVFSYRKPKNG